MIVRLWRAALVDVGALVVDSVRWALVDLGRWLTKDDDHLADLGDDHDGLHEAQFRTAAWRDE